MNIFFLLSFIHSLIARPFPSCYPFIILTFFFFMFSTFRFSWSFSFHLSFVGRFVKFQFSYIYSILNEPYHFVDIVTEYICLIWQTFSTLNCVSQFLMENPEYAFQKTKLFKIMIDFFHKQPHKKKTNESNLMLFQTKEAKH